MRYALHSLIPLFVCLPHLDASQHQPLAPEDTVSFYDDQVVVRRATPGQWQWHPLAIGNGGYNLGLTFDPKQPERIYLRSDVSGVIRTTNGGNNWMTSNNGLHGLANGNYGIGAIAVDPHNTARLYASLSRTHNFPSGIVRSEDYGESWEFISSQIAIDGEGPRSRKQGGPGILIDPRDPARLYAINTRQNDGAGGIWTSADSGSNWTPTGLQTAQISTLRFAADNPDTLYASAINHSQSAGGMWLSTDSGQSWQRIGLEGKDVFNFNFEHNNPTIIYAATGLDGIYKSEDAGKTWTQINNGLPLDRDGKKGQFFKYVWRALDTSPHTPGHLIAAADVIRAIYESRDYGKTWQRLPFDSMEPPAGWMLSPHHMGWHTSNVYFHPQQPGTLFSCDFFATWRSDDGGRTWRTNPYGAENSCMTTVLPDADTPNRIYLGLWDHDLIIYNDATIQPYTQRVSGARQDSRGTNHHASSVAQNSASPDNLLAVMNSAALIRSEDRGLSWTRITHGLPDDTYWRLGAPAFAPQAGLALLPIGASEQAPATDIGIYLSEDNGASWRHAANRGLPEDLYVTGRWDTRQNVFATTPDASLLALVSNGILYLSTDLANTWTAPALPTATGKPLKASRVTVQADGTLLVGMLEGGGLWSTATNGENWTQVWAPASPRADIELLAADPQNPHRILLHTFEKPANTSPSGRIHYQLLLSEDSGQNWVELLNPTLAIWRLRSIAFDPFDTDRVLASTQWGGTWAATRPRSSVSVQPFGTIPQGHTDAGHTVYQYTLGSSDGLSLSVMNYGAAIISIQMPDRNGHRANITQSFETLEQFLGTNPYYGATIGRYAGRIPNGKLLIEGEIFTIAANDGAHSLHGGPGGFAHRFWNAQILYDEGGDTTSASSRSHTQAEHSVRFTLTSKAMDQGYPGTVQASVTYTLNPETNRLTIHYQASTDQPTAFNPTNHTYFNLSGSPRSAAAMGRQQLTLGSGQWMQIDNDWCATADTLPTDGTDMDFRTPVPLGERLYTPRTLPTYFDHTFILDNATHADALRMAARLYDPHSGRHLQIDTDRPALHFYAGNSLHKLPTGGASAAPERFSAIALEPMEWPICIASGKPHALLRPGESYSATDVYTFSIH